MSLWHKIAAPVPYPSWASLIGFIPYPRVCGTLCLESGCAHNGCLKTRSHSFLLFRFDTFVGEECESLRTAASCWEETQCAGMLPDPLRGITCGCARMRAGCLEGVPDWFSTLPSDRAGARYLGLYLGFLSDAVHPWQNSFWTQVYKTGFWGIRNTFPVEMKKVKDNRWLFPVTWRLPSSVWRIGGKTELFQ